MSAGIDARSSATDVADALHRLGAELQLAEQNGRWQATVTATSGPGAGMTGDGATRNEAARQAWERFRARQGGSGTS